MNHPKSNRLLLTILTAGLLLCGCSEKQTPVSESALAATSEVSSVSASDATSETLSKPATELSSAPNSTTTPAEGDDIDGYDICEYLKVEIPAGFTPYYNRYSGELFIYPKEWTVEDGDDTAQNAPVTLQTPNGALMLMMNWTGRTEELLGQGMTAEEIYDDFLNACATVLTSTMGEMQVVDYTTLEPTPSIFARAAFSFQMPDGSLLRAFCELAMRETNGETRIQGTLALYEKGDSASIDMFSTVMDNTHIIYLSDLL